MRNLELVPNFGGLVYYLCFFVHRVYVTHKLFGKIIAVLAAAAPLPIVRATEGSEMNGICFVQVLHGRRLRWITEGASLCMVNP